MGIPTISTAPMSVEEFYAFTDGRPDEERWELIEGEPMMQASPGFFHQVIAANLITALKTRRAGTAGWTVIPGIGVRVSGASLPQPDVMVVPTPARSDHRPGAGLRHADNPLVVFEILSPSTADRDLRWKRNAYTALPSLTHYVVIAQDAIEVAVFAREAGFAERRLRSRDDTIAFADLGVTLSLDEIFRDTGL